jgi:hypothetical protein
MNTYNVTSYRSKSSNRSLKVCIVGTHQTGSTRLFNLVRMIYESKNKSVFSSYMYTETNDSNSDVIVSKVHDADYQYLDEFDIVLMPLRNILDACISGYKRFNLPYNDSCYSNIYLFNKFKSKAHFIFKYEEYSVFHIKQLCKILHVKLTDIEIIKIMKELDAMLKSEDIVPHDNFNDELYKKTLLCRQHNTSGGLSNKFVSDINIKELENLLKNREINNFLQENKYI